MAALFRKLLATPLPHLWRLASGSALTAAQVKFYKEEGYLVVENAVTEPELAALRAECDYMVRSYDLAEHKLSVFKTVNQSTDDYFLQSGDKVRFFFEEGALNADGNLQVPIDRAFNKIGHALHVHSSFYKAFSHKQLFKNIATSIGYQHPLLVQSMYIFKQPGIGGVVSPHQDSTFINTAPMTTMGYWIPVQDATLDNGCLWAIPKSHLNGIHNKRRMIRCVDPKNPWAVSTSFTADIVSYKEEDFVPLEMKRGSMLLIHGEVVHRSHANKSEKARHAYTLHVIEGAQGVVYDHLNWLQYTNLSPFVPL
eukprot:m.28480 g.28480  ORF g.28480 m.28480 type:complete len:310 (+) comp40189_c0_seq1:83-1012(+)